MYAENCADFELPVRIPPMLYLLSTLYLLCSPYAAHCSVDLQEESKRMVTVNTERMIANFFFIARDE
jgi:hypothetical protein